MGKEKKREGIGRGRTSDQMTSLKKVPPAPKKIDALSPEPDALPATLIRKQKEDKKKEIAHARKKTNAAKFVKLKIGKKFGKGREDCEELGDEQCSPPVVKSREHPGVESLGSVLRT